MKYHGKQALILLLAAAASLHGRNGQLGVIVVDIQADFVELPVKDPRTLQEMSKKGALAVDGTDQKYINAAEKATDQFRSYNIPIFFTQDWHPVGHVSFASTWKDKGYKNIETYKPFPAPSLQTVKKDDKGYKVIGQFMWPDHCVQGSPGARILLKVQHPQDVVIQKGMDVYSDSYSGFKDKSGKPTPLADKLHERGITDLIIYGIATDYCVHDTMQDGLNEGFGVHLIINLSRGIDKPAGSMLDKIAKLQEQGAKIYYIKDLQDGTSVSEYSKQGINLIICNNIANFMNEVYKNIRSGPPVAPKMKPVEKITSQYTYAITYPDLEQEIQAEVEQKAAKSRKQAIEEMEKRHRNIVKIQDEPELTEQERKGSTEQQQQETDVLMIL